MVQEGRRPGRRDLPGRPRILLRERSRRGAGWAWLDGRPVLRRRAIVGQWLMTWRAPVQHVYHAAHRTLHSPTAGAPSCAGGHQYYVVDGGASTGTLCTPPSPQHTSEPHLLLAEPRHPTHANPPFLVLEFNFIL